MTAAPATDADYEAAIDSCTTSAWPARSTTSTATATRRRASGTRSRAYRTPLRRDPGLRDHGQDLATGESMPATPIAYSPADVSLLLRRPERNGVVEPGESSGYTPGPRACFARPTTISTRQGPRRLRAQRQVHRRVPLRRDRRPERGRARCRGRDPRPQRPRPLRQRPPSRTGTGTRTPTTSSPVCARCHCIEGFQFVVKYGIDQTIPAEISSGMSCETCQRRARFLARTTGNMPERRYLPSVPFPFPPTATSTQIAAATIDNGAEGTSAQDDSFICMTCHRAASPSGPSTPPTRHRSTTFTLSFRNVHYLRAGATHTATWPPCLPVHGQDLRRAWDHGTAYAGPYPQPKRCRRRCCR